MAASAPDITLTAAAERLRAGGADSLVVMPTETVYGLAGVGTDLEAVAAIFAAKERPAFDPLILHVADAAMVEDYAAVSSIASSLMAEFWPGPLTLVLPRTEIVPDLVCNSLPLVGVRCPAHPLARQLIAAVGKPLAAPSANRFGATSPTTATAVRPQLNQPLIPVLDGGPCHVGLESTVLRPDPQPVILRPGGVTVEQLNAFLGQDVAVANDPERAAAIDAPGRLPAHYAPTVPVRLITAWTDVGTDWNRLYWQQPGSAPELSGSAQWLALTDSGDPVQGASRLFHALLTLAENGRPIAVEPVPEIGLGVAIADRLRRAAASKVAES